MKKFIIGAFLLISFCACDPPEWLYGHSAYWYIKNTTDIPLKIEADHTDFRTNLDLRMGESLTIAPGDSILICQSGRCFGDNEFPPFEDFLGLDGLYVYDADGKILREWFKINREDETCSIFKEGEWRHYIEPRGGGEFLFTWVYDISNEDIKPVIAMDPNSREQ